MFDLRVRFDPNNPPVQIWRVTEAFQHSLNDPTSTDPPLRPNAAGEVHTTFHNPTPGRAHGLHWR
jgi:hypothetical protein